MSSVASFQAQPNRLSELSDHPIHLAPMVGLTHIAVRKALQEYLPRGRKVLWPTEMLSSRRIPSQKKNQTPEIIMEDREQGLCPQLLANEESFIRDSILRLVDWGARAIDINMGCPVQKALKHNYGVALMGDPEYAAEVTALAVKYAQGLPVSVKLRAAPMPEKETEGASVGQGGSQPESKNDPSARYLTYVQEEEYLHRFCLLLQSAGASWIALHPRTAAQQRKGSADWSQVMRLKKVLTIPLIGNGDIQTLNEANQRLHESACDRVMVGRALMSKPWILAANGTPDSLEQGAIYGRFLMRVLDYSREFFPEPYGVRKFKFLIRYGAGYLEFGHTLTARIAVTQTYAEVSAVLREFFGADFERPHRMSERTQFRY